jgi:hypothetical protein
MPGYTATVYPPDLQNRKVEALELTESPQKKFSEKNV